MASPTSDQPATTGVRYGVLPLHQVAAVSGLDFLRGMIAGLYPAPPIAEIAGMRLGSADEGHVEFEGEPSHAFLNPLGTVHGGWTSIILDTVMACAVHSTLRAGQGYTTAEFKVHFVRPVLPDAGRVRAVGSVIHAGGRLADLRRQALRRPWSPVGPWHRDMLPVRRSRFGCGLIDHRRRSTHSQPLTFRPGCRALWSSSRPGAFADDRRL